MKKTTLLVMLFIGITAICYSQITPTGSYSVIGDVIITDVTNDGDNGDGIGDGAKYIDGQSAVVGQGTLFVFDGTMENGATYNISTTIYNPNGSFCSVTTYLFNATDNVSLTTSTSSGLASADVDTLLINYTAMITDAGDQLELRYVRDDDGNVARNFSIDILKLNGTPVSPTPPDTLSPNGTWSPIGNTLLTNTTNDTDNGDGIGDGAIFVDGATESLGLGAAFTLDDTLEEGTVYEAVATLFNPGNSYNKVTLSLYNVTDNKELAITPITNLPSGTASVLTISYTAITTDTGDILELRFLNAMDTNQVRDFSIDNASIGGSVISTDITSLSIENNILNDNVSVYPNPAQNILNITATNINIKNISLINILGKTIYTSSFSKTINISAFYKGLYVLRIESTEGGVITKKIILK